MEFDARVRGPIRRVAIDELPTDRPGWAADAQVVNLVTESGRTAHATASLARLLVAAAAGDDPAAPVVDPESFVPEYVSPSQAERVHGVDLREELARPIQPRPWS